MPQPGQAGNGTEFAKVSILSVSIRTILQGGHLLNLSLMNRFAWHICAGDSKDELLLRATDNPP
jgi:hypothetical protein